MKTKTKIAIVCGCACVATLVFAGCTVWDTPYDSIENKGYTVSVRYDINGGEFSASPQTDVVDVFHIDTAKRGVKLIDPGSEERVNDKGNAAGLLPTRSGYSLAGWYRVREPRVDGSGNALDEYGELCTVSGRAQGLEYGGRWDFDTDVFRYENEPTEDVALTLYAAWVPNFTYRFLTSDGTAGEYAFNPTLQEGKLELPYWADERAAEELKHDAAALEKYLQETFKGSMTYGSFPRVSDKTFAAIYSDSLMTQQITEDVIVHEGSIDLETGTAVNPVQTFYTTWSEGTQYHIYTAKQLAENTNIAGVYEIRRDLDFSLKDTQDFLIARWGAGFTEGDFSGKFIGIGEGGRTVSNINIVQTSTSQLRGGLFGRLMDGSVIENITFENVTYELNAASRMQGSEFGPFAGNISSGATLSNVKIVNGTLSIGAGIYTGYTRYQVGTVASNYSGTGVTHDIRVVLKPRVSGTTKTWPHAVTIGTNGILTISANPDTSKEPEIKHEEQATNGGNNDE